MNLYSVSGVLPERHSCSSTSAPWHCCIGYLPLEEFPELWGPRLSVLQLVKVLGGG